VYVHFLGVLATLATYFYLLVGYRLLALPDALFTVINQFIVNICVILPDFGGSSLTRFHSEDGVEGVSYWVC